jgi:predicted PurR-regulated permease PerM
MSTRLSSIITPFFTVAGLLLSLALTWQLRGLVMIFFVCLIMASAMRPVVEWGGRKRIPRPLTIILLYILILFVLSVILSFLIPPLVTETTQLISRVSSLIGVSELQLDGFASLDISRLGTSFRDYGSLLNQLGGSINAVLQVIFSTFSFLFVFATALVLTFYILLSFDHLALSYAWLLPGGKSEQAAKARRIMKNIQHQLGSWVRGELALMSIIGLLTYIGLALLGIPYALPLAILAGLFEILPNLGPTVAAVPAVLVAFFLVSPFMGLAVLLLSIVVQQLENNLIVPQIMREAVDVRPVTTILLMLAGFRLLGVMGALLVIPFYITVRSIVQELWPDQGPFSDFSKLE